MLTADGWRQYAVWEHSASLRALYAARCRMQAEEMTCHAQAAELLAPYVGPGETVLDVGCGSGYFYHALARRHIPAAYWGMDASNSLLDIGRGILPEYGLPAARLLTMRIEDMAGSVDHAVCLNVLSNSDNYHRPLDRILHCTRKTVVLRESLGKKGQYSYVRDAYLDPGVDIFVHVNTYPVDAVVAFIEERGFSATVLEDRRTGGQPELVIGYPHSWTFVLARRR